MLPAPLSAAAREVARGLFAREMGREADDAALAAAAERICTRVLDGLSRWLGPVGSQTLVARALTRTQANHHVLAAVTITAQPTRVTGFAANVRAYGAKATADGVVDLFAVLANLISRLIGDDLAFNLLEQSTAGFSEHDSSVADEPEAPVATPSAAHVTASAESAHTGIRTRRNS